MNARLEPPAVFRTDLAWDNHFHSLGAEFFTPLAPQPLPAPYWVGRSALAAGLLGLSATELASDDWLQALSGNRPISGTRPLASVYGGHQFGHWAGQLGDGRAILLGETGGWEVQLKGSGLTPYSRMGDGRAVLRSSIREFLASEAMHALGIPSSRALCVTGSDEPVQRETQETAAVVTRLAPSFIRFGHFEHFFARNQLAQLKALADHVIERHYPDCRAGDGFAGNAYAALLQAVTRRTARLLAHWQAAGFCHGVMNTDNMSILGLTLDYGPFQFLDAYDPAHVCNHSDHQGRYAFDNQPDVAHWNLFCLAQALLPLIGDTEPALQALATFKPDFEQHWHALMLAKLGLQAAPADADAADPSPATRADAELVRDILHLLARERIDYTIFWRRLSHSPLGDTGAPVRELFLQAASFDAWHARYRQRQAGRLEATLRTDMLACNPRFVLRNHLGELAIRAAQERDLSVLESLQGVLAAPFDEHPAHAALADFPPAWADGISISCSS